MTVDDIKNNPKLKAQYERWRKYSEILGDNFSDEEYLKAMENGDAQYLMDILSEKEKVTLYNMLSRDKDFSDGEKCMFAVMLGLPAKTRWVAAALGISHVAVTKIEKRAMEKLKMFREVKDKSTKDYENLKATMKKQAEQAMADGRYAHKGNISGQGRFAKKG